MPLNLNLNPKPRLRFASPNGSTVFLGEKSHVPVSLSPMVVGAGRVILTCLADHMAFQVGASRRRELTVSFQCHDPQETIRLQLSFELTSSQPSDQDILVRFDAKAINHAGQTSPFIPQLPVRVKPARSGRLPSEKQLPAMLGGLTEATEEPPSRSDVAPEVSSIPPAVANPPIEESEDTSVTPALSSETPSSPSLEHEASSDIPTSPPETPEPSQDSPNPPTT